MNINGENTYGTVVTGIAWTSQRAIPDCYDVTRPAADDLGQEKYSNTSERRHERRRLDRDRLAGTGYSAGTEVADLLGTSPPDSAEHMGTTPGNLDTSQGLVSALGGAAATRFRSRARK